MDKKDILAKSFKIINERGLEDFSMRKLADVLDCKPASIYHYYQNKNEILNDLYVNIFKKFFVANSKKEYSTLEDYLFDHCKLVQKNKKEYIFLMKYRRSGFLDKKVMMKLKEAKKMEVDRMNKLCSNADKSLVTHLLIMGPISELAFFEMNNPMARKLSDDELKELIKRICIAIRSDV